MGEIVVGAVLALVGVCVGEVLSSRRQNTLLREEKLRSQRDIIVELVVAARGWHEIQSVLVVAIGKFTTSDFVSFMDTDTGRSSIVAAQRLKAALTRARLFIDHREMRQPVAEMVQFFDGYPDKVTGPILKSSGDTDAIAAGIGHLKRFGNSVTELEKTAVDALASRV